MSGESTDDIILNFLRQAGVDLDDDVVSIGQLETDAVVAACARCVNAIAESKGEEQRYAEKLGGNPGVRFRACTNLAGAISALGFPGEIGFNHFLYPSEAETRKLLLFLVDAMPKSGGDGDDSGLVGGAGSFDDQLKAALQKAQETPWVPHTWQPRPRLPAGTAHLRALLARSALGAARRAERQDALERRLQSLGGADAAGGAGGALSGGFGEALAGWGADEHGNAYGPAGGASGGLFAHSAMFAHDEAGGAAVASAGEGERETAVQRAERAEREKLEVVRAELEEVGRQIEGAQRKRDAARAEEAALAAAARQLEAEAQAGKDEEARREREYAVRTRTLELAADPEGSKARLTKANQQSAAALMELAEEWEEHRAPMLAEIREAELALQARRDGAAAKMAHVRSLRGEMKGMVLELGERDEAVVRLTKELAKASGPPRASYTDRIMDIIKNLRKQKLGIEQILSDIRESQKEVNSLSETLQRSFAAADEVIFRDAVKVPASKQCYKALAAMHDAFGRLGVNVQEIANAASAKNELEAKAAELAARNTAEAIEKISADLKAIKLENAKLKADAN